ncbi:MAG: hypothetical protein M3619_00600 [Myxococcota bacterium]|nr:hypothetical protein [Myxococcota bacterium]
MKSIAELAAATDPARVSLRGAIRRMVVTITGTLTAAKSIWQVAGFRMPDGSTEAFKVEAFTGIGFFARPPSNVQAEVIVLMTGADGETPVAVAVRDEKTRAAIAGALKANETAMFNSQVILHMTEAGTIEARSAAGVAVPLALKSDVVAVDNKYASHIHPDSTGAPTGAPASAVPPVVPPTVPPTWLPGVPLAGAGIVGTSILKGH